MRLALCICPQWSVQTPSFAIGSLKSHINNKDVVVDQIDLNILSSIYTKEKNIEKFWDWGNDKPWNSETNFQTEILPYFKELWHEYIEKLSTYDVVAFTTYTSNIITTDYIARYVKQKNPKIQIWYGGPYSWYSECGGLVEKDNYREFVDIACGSNDGERIISDLVNKYLEDGHYENIRGIYRWDKISPSFPTVLKKGRSGRTPVFNGGLLPQNLNELETPSWDESVIDDYRKLAELFDLEVTLPMQTSRGCTFKCTFCSETRLYRYKNNEKIVDEMKGLEAQTGINNFWFTDSLINGSMPNFKKFVDHMLLLFNFEKKYFDKENIPNTFVGHPLLENDDKSKINIYPCASLTKNIEGTNMTEFGLLQKKGIIAFTDGFKTIQNPRLMSRIMNSAKDLGCLIMQHAEDYELAKNGMINSGIIASKLGLSGIPEIAERILIERDLTLLENTKCRYHISQLSSQKSVEVVKQRKEIVKKKIQVPFCETLKC